MFFFSVDEFLDKRKQALPPEEQLRILLDNMDAANSNRKGMSKNANEFC